MTKKAIKYTIILLLIPIIVSIILSFTNLNIDSGPSENFNSIDVSTYKNVDNDSIKSNNTFLYLSVFTFVAIGAASLLYIKKKGQF